ncbi:MAG: hypothetical protein E6J89_08595 [Deltaproteobacteria bacterium]|nr:MAG: hypothetical protein E6J89_08595 [Deltaproteobacteria bacterium]
MRRPAKLSLLPVLLIAGVALLGAAVQSERKAASVPPPSPKYIFIFLSDGAGITHMEITRMYSRIIHNEGLNVVDKIMKQGSIGLMTTHAANSLSTDSAAAATALASGCKAKIGAIGSCEDGTIPKTVLEIAKENGMRIGLITNSTLYDASPAAFAGHVPDRTLYGPIVDQYLKLEPDLLMGGGRDEFLPRSQPGSRRKDDSDMIGAFVKRGYVYVADKNELARARGAKVLGLFSLGEISFEIDRHGTNEPSVSDMTRAAIRRLEEGNRSGFVLFIEDEHVDSAAHLLDIASLIQEYREFDRAVGVGYEFYLRHPEETLILVTSDHEIGGLGFTQALEELSVVNRKRIAATEQDFKKIQSIKISLKKAAEILGPNPTAEAVDQLMRDHFNGFIMAPDLKNMLLNKQVVARNLYTNPVVNCLGLMIANNIQAYWGTTAHTNQPVFVAALGVGSERFRGYQDNTDFAKHLFALLKKKMVAREAER